MLCLLITQSNPAAAVTATVRPDRNMKCPICDQAMEAGEVQLRKSLINTMAFGWGATDLVFKGTESRKTIELMNAWKFSKAYHCMHCGASLIATNKTGL